MENIAVARSVDHVTMVSESKSTDVRTNGPKSKDAINQEPFKNAVRRRERLAKKP